MEFALLYILGYLTLGVINLHIVDPSTSKGEIFHFFLGPFLVLPNTYLAVKSNIQRRNEMKNFEDDK